MLTPTTALAWELWRRHRPRFVLIAGTVLAFILVYPRLCALAGFNPASPEASDEIARILAPKIGQPSPTHIAHILYILFLGAGPVLAMVMTQLALTWMFTFTEFNPKTNDLLAFPMRLFTLPVSTPFLFWRLVPGGLMAVLGLYAAWVYCVPMPHLEIFAVYQNCFGWMTLLVLGQGVVWALAAWPVIRTLAWITVLGLFLMSPARRDIIEKPMVLPLLFLLGGLLAHAGLQKMRHGQWQGWSFSFVNRTARAELRGPKRFASPAQAQLWFEWRRLAGKICFFTSALALVPVGLSLLRVIAGYPILPADDMNGFSVFLAGAPLFIYFLSGVSPMRTDQPFLLVRPLTSGEMLMPILKTAAIGTVIAWAMVLMAFGLLPWLGDFHAVAQGVSPVPGRRAAIVIGLVFLTWRSAVINLCFSLTGHRRITRVPALLLVAAYVIGVTAFLLTKSGFHWDWLLNHLSGWAAALVVVKFLLAFQAFRTSVKRGLLTPATVACYLGVWNLMVAALIATLWLLARPDQFMVLPACLGIVLLVPLARIGLCPLALAYSRHT